MREAEELTERAEEFLEASRILRGAGLWHASFDDAHHAAEIAGKALLLISQGSYPRKHQIAGELHAAGLIPPGIDPKQVSRVLGAWTVGRYGFEDRIEPEQVETAIQVAQALVDALKGVGGVT